MIQFPKRLDAFFRKCPDRGRMTAKPMLWFTLLGFLFGVNFIGVLFFDWDMHQRDGIAAIYQLSQAQVENILVVSALLSCVLLATLFWWVFGTDGDYLKDERKFYAFIMALGGASGLFLLIIHFLKVWLNKFPSS